MVSMKDVCWENIIMSLFPKSIMLQASHPLELVHSDIYKRITTPLGGVKYLLTFIDDLSHFLWIYTIQYKDEALKKFQEF